MVLPLMDLLRRPFGLVANTTGVTRNNSSAENTLCSISILGGTLGTDDLLEFVFWLNVTNDTADAHTYIFNVYYGITLMTTFTLSLNNGFTDVVKVEGVLNADGATNAQRMLARFFACQEDVTGGSSSADSGTAAEDSTANKNLILTCTMQHAHADLSVSFRAAYVVEIKSP
jgi:hypothetical protein